MSKNTAAVDILLLKLKVTWSVNLIHSNVVLWRARKPNWLSLSRHLSSMCFWNIFRNTFSKSLRFMDRRPMGRKFWGNIGSVPGFGNVTTFASFQGFGKWESRRQWLNKWVKFTNGRLRRCPRHSFGMPSIPQAFLNFEEFIHFCISHGVILWGRLLSTFSSRAWTLASTRHLWFSSHKSCIANWIPKISAIVLDF
jgi:hypothetical protein